MQATFPPNCNELRFFSFVTYKLLHDKKTAHHVTSKTFESYYWSELTVEAKKPRTIFYCE